MAENVKEKIAETFLAMTARKSFDKITIKDLVQECGISRQGVWDNIRRGESALENIEEKTGLLRRFEENRSALEHIQMQIKELAALTQGELREKAAKAAENIAAVIARG